MADSDMSAEKRKKLISYGVTAAFAAAVTLIYCIYAGVFSTSEAGQVVGLLSNGFSISGVLFTGIGLLVFVKRQGVFDGVMYGTRYMFNWLLPQVWLKRDELSGSRVLNYHDYCEEKREHEKEKFNPIRCFIIVGVVFLALGIAFMVIMNVWYPDTKLGTI